LVRRSADGPHEIADDAQVDRIVHVLPDLSKPLSWPRRIVTWIQHLWPIPVAGLVALGWFSYQAYEQKVIKGGFWRFPDPETLICYVRMPDGTDVQVTSETFLKFEQALLPIHDGVRMRANVFGNQAYMEVEFEEELLRTGIPMLYRSLLQEQADQTGGTSIFIRGFDDSPYVKGNFGGSALNSLVKITGYNSKILTQIAEDTLAKISRERRVRNARITSSSRFGRSTNEETVITLKRDVLADHGLSVMDVVARVRRLLGVDTPWRMLIEGDQERVQLAYYDSEDIEFSEVAAYVMDTPQGEKVRLGDLVLMETVPLSDAISRENQRYTMFVNWEYVGTDKMRQAYIKRILDSMDLPYGYSAEEARREFFTEEEESELAQTLILALIFIFLIMAALFESVALPVLVLLAVPMALVGVVWLFAWTTTPFDSSARIGLVLLFGIVVNNAILLVSRYRHECALVLKARLGGDPEAEAGILHGMRKSLGGYDLWLLPKEERGGLLRRAVARGTLIRMRSILLTSGTTIVGLLPLLVTIEKVPSTILGLDLPLRLRFMGGQDQDIWENLALSSIGGLVSSTILLLVMMPALYYMFVRIFWLLRSAVHWLRSRVGGRRPIAVEPSPGLGGAEGS
jgi:HAE1 family hydrophobic/amphiphilic exporter-1